MFIASTMVVPLLLMKNTVGRFLCAEIRIGECFTRFNKLHERGTLPSAHVSSERAHQQHVEEQENILEMLALRPVLEDFLHVSVFHEHVYG
jgi:hypothetical protein